ncbi:hypothetical protein [Streptomyces fructofermentans]|uniref:hypothetical protein n=1 Tax=Streptomyces fructofermentans TaxID=152141 RepID=UPI0033D788C2
MLDEYRDADVRLVVLMMAEGANQDGEPQSLARLICERWEMDVIAPAGSARVTSDGTLFAPEVLGESGGWWHFSPGESIRRVSTAVPVPSWKTAVKRVGRQVVGGYEVEPVPAGLAIRPVGPVPAATRTSLHMLPPERERPHLVIASPTVPVAVLAVVIAALPHDIRGRLRLVSLNGQPLLETGVALAELLGSDVRVAVGAPLAVKSSSPSDVLTGDVTVDLGLVDAAGVAWQPFARTVVCSPVPDGSGAQVRVAEWEVPPALNLGDGSAVVTPAGVWIGPGGCSPPPLAGARPWSAEALAIELGAPRRIIDDALWEELEQLVAQLEPEMRRRAVVHVHGVRGIEEERRLLRVAKRYDLRAG